MPDVPSAETSPIRSVSFNEAAVRNGFDDQDNQEADALLTDRVNEGTEPGITQSERSFRLRLFAVKAVALLCACSLSIGSHYATYILAPLKSRLSREMGTSNTEFSLLLSAFTLNSTWTPLVGGMMASRLGTTSTSILATGIIFSGLLLLLVGDLVEDVKLMTSGMFIFGLGVSPLAVVQETIIVRFFHSHGLGISMALGLVVGKMSSFVSARTSYPLSQRFGPHAPFYAATGLAAISFIVNIIYVLTSRWLVSVTGTEPEVSDLRYEARRHGSIQDVSEEEALRIIAKKKKVNLRDMTQLGDVFWAYIGVNVLCGSIWHPFTHLAANVIESRYGLSELDASTKASYILAGSMFLYPTVGFIIDRVKRPGFVLMLLAFSSILTMFAYVWLVLPPETIHGNVWPAIASFAAGIGFSPLLLVVVVPQLVPMKYVSTTLGAHKSLEQTGTTISQTLAGLILDAKLRDSPTPSIGDKRIQHLLNYFLMLNMLQLLGIICLWYLDRQTKSATTHHRQNSPLEPVEIIPPTKVPGDVSHGEESYQPLESSSSASHNEAEHDPLLPDRSRQERQYRRPRSSRKGWIFMALCAVLIATAWVLFLVTAWLRLRSKEERGKLNDV